MSKEELTKAKEKRQRGGKVQDEVDE